MLQVALAGEPVSQRVTNRLGACWFWLWLI